MPEEMSQTLLINKKQGKIRLRDAINIFWSTKLRINRKKYFIFIKQEEPLKNLKISLDLSIFV